MTAVSFNALLHFSYYCRYLNITHFRQLLNLQRVGGGIRQTEIQTAEPFVPEPSVSETEVAVGKLKRYESPGADQIPAELISDS
jgi:hypothetical protein